MSGPFFSVIVPVYRVEKYLRECLDSITGQSFSDYEVILVDDGSPDNCPAICDEYSEKYDNFLVIHQENAGLSAARNAGIRQARGRYLIFLDSDDKFASVGCLEELHSFCCGDKHDVVYCSGIARFSQETIHGFIDVPSKVGLSKEDFFMEIAHKKGIFCAQLFIISRIIVHNYQLFFTEKILHEGMDWIPRVLLAREKVSVSIFSKPFYLYRVNPESITGSFTRKRYDSMILVLERLLEMDAAKSGCAFVSLWFNMNLYTLIVYLEEDCRNNSVDFDHRIEKVEQIIKSNFFKLNFRNKCIYLLSRLSWKWVYALRRGMKG